jgi:predicted nucleotidyltransferase
MLKGNAFGMTESIKKELKRLEIRHQMKILPAVEPGSRAWGFESIDSDWDVRFFYIHKPEWYLSIRERKDNIEEMLPG